MNNGFSGWSMPGWNPPYINIQDQKASGGVSGTFTSGAWQTRTLNTIVSDVNAIASVVNNLITLPAGTYRCHARCGAVSTDWHQARLQNITSGSTLLTGSNSYANSGLTYAGTDSWIQGQFTLTVTSVLSLQHRASTTRTNDGFGIATSFSVEVYAVAEFWKLG